MRASYPETPRVSPRSNSRRIGEGSACHENSLLAGRPASRARAIRGLARMMRHGPQGHCRHPQGGTMHCLARGIYQGYVTVVGRLEARSRSPPSTQRYYSRSLPQKFSQRRSVMQANTTHVGAWLKDGALVRARSPEIGMTL